MGAYKGPLLGVDGVLVLFEISFPREILVANGTGVRFRSKKSINS